MSLSFIPLRRIENIFSAQIVCHYAQTDDALNERLKYWIEAIHTTWNGLVTATVRLHICMQYYNVHSAFPTGGKKVRKKPSHCPILPTDIIGWFSKHSWGILYLNHFVSSYISHQSWKLLCCMYACNQANTAKLKHNVWRANSNIELIKHRP